MRTGPAGPGFTLPSFYRQIEQKFHVTGGARSWEDSITPRSVFFPMSYMMSNEVRVVFLYVFRPPETAHTKPARDRGGTAIRCMR